MPNDKRSHKILPHPAKGDPRQAGTFSSKSPGEKKLNHTWEAKLQWRNKWSIDPLSLHGEHKSEYIFRWYAFLSKMIYHQNLPCTANQQQASTLGGARSFFSFLFFFSFLYNGEKNYSTKNKKHIQKTLVLEISTKNYLNRPKTSKKQKHKLAMSTKVEWEGTERLPSKKNSHTTF